MKQRAAEEYTQIDQGSWAPFPDTLSVGGIMWKLLHVSPEAGTWTAIFECPAGSSFNAHIHTGPGEYFLYKGKMEVRGGAENGGDTAIAPGYGYEASGARHDHTYFPHDSAFYMTFSGPIAFIQPDGTVVGLVGWGEVQGAWEAHLQSGQAAA
jgi:acetylacetone-cleaving enzyme